MFYHLLELHKMTRWDFANYSGMFSSISWLVCIL